MSLVEETPPPPDPRRALDALERAAVCAQSGEPDRPLVLVRPEDFRAASASMARDLRARLDEVLMGADPEAGLDALLTCGALDALLPEVRSLVGFGDGEWRHKDVWKHTKQVVRQAVPKIEVRWGALLHDIGKVKTRSISPDGEVHFFGHAEVGARMFDKMERRLRLFSGEQKLGDAVRFLILFHLRPAGYETSWTDSAVRRFGRELDAHLDDLLCLARADITTKRPEKKRKGLRQIDELAERIGKIRERDAVVPVLPKGIGDALMAHFRLPPSRVIGDVKRALEGEIAAGELAPYEPSEFYVEHVAAHAERYGLKG